MGFLMYLVVTLYMGIQTVASAVVTSLVVGILALLLPTLRKDNSLH